MIGNRYLVVNTADCDKGSVGKCVASLGKGVIVLSLEAAGMIRFRLFYLHELVEVA
jgi:hypothetical protein